MNRKYITLDYQEYLDLLEKIDKSKELLYWIKEQSKQEHIVEAINSLGRELRLWI